MKQGQAGGTPTLKWEEVYNTVRPHQTLGYLTPEKFLEHCHQNQRRKVRCHWSYERVQNLLFNLISVYNTFSCLGEIARGLFMLAIFFVAHF